MSDRVFSGRDVAEALGLAAQALGCPRSACATSSSTREPRAAWAQAHARAGGGAARGRGSAAAAAVPAGERAPAPAAAGPDRGRRPAREPGRAAVEARR